MYYSTTSDFTAAALSVPCVYRVVSRSVGAQVSLVLSPLWAVCCWLCSLLKVWLTAGSFLQRDVPVPSCVLSLLLAGCVTEPVQLAKRAKPHLTAGVCCHVKLALEGPSESCCWCKEEGRTLQAAEGKEKGMEPLVLVGVSSCQFSSVAELKSMEGSLLYKKTQNRSDLWFGRVSFSEVTM